MLQSIDLITLFPAMAEGFLSESMLGRAVATKRLRIASHNLRDYSEDKHRRVDDRPFGGDAGMVLKPEPVFKAVESLKKPESHTIFLSPDGEKLSSGLARQLAQYPHLILLSGHYEGLDQRARDALMDREISIGDYVLTNGTLPACVLIDAVARHIPGVIGDEKSLTQDSFNNRLLGSPQYTRPARYRDLDTPEVLLSGNPAKIKAWQRQQQLKKTALRRPDLIENQKTHASHTRQHHPKPTTPKPPKL